MAKQRKFDQETRDRAVRMYRERRRTDPQESMIASRRHVGGLLGIGSETLRGWIEREEVNAGERPGVPDSESETVRTLGKGKPGLKRANEILKVASAYVGDRCQVPVSSRRSSRLAKIA